MQNFFSTLLVGAVTLVSMVGGFFGASTVAPLPSPTPEPISAPLGATIPKVIASFTTSLASKITSSATSLTLVSATDDAGTVLSGYICAVLDVGTADEEFICGTASSTSMTGLLRGIDPIQGSLEVTALKKEHRRGASVKITDYPVLGILARILNGDETLPNKLQYDSVKTFTSSTQLVDKNYVDNTAFAGAPAGTDVIAGIGIFSTKTELATGSTTRTYGTTTYSLFPKNSHFNATTSATTTGVVTGSNGKISQGFLDLTEGFTFSGGVTSTGALVQSGTTTFSGVNTITGTTTFTGSVTGASKFGGTGLNGVLSVTSGTTTLDLTGSSTKIFNYSSINISATGTVVFSNPHANGTIIILKSVGNVTITCTSTPCINASTTGASAGTNATDILDASNHFGAGASGTTGGTGGVILANKYFYTATLARLYKKQIVLIAGSGGETGVNGGTSSPGGTGGTGGGGIYIEVGGALNFTTTNGISVSGGAGGVGVNGLNNGASQSGAGGGGGGGAAGSVVILYNTLIANTGTINITGGAGSAGGNGNGNGGSVGGNGGGGGAGAGSYLGAGGNGGAGTNSSGSASASTGGAGGTANGNNGSAGSITGGASTFGGAGGGGGAGHGGFSLVAPNTEF